MREHHEGACKSAGSRAGLSSVRWTPGSACLRPCPVLAYQWQSCSALCAGTRSVAHAIVSCHPSRLYAWDLQGPCTQELYMP